MASQGALLPHILDVITYAVSALTHGLDEDRLESLTPEGLAETRRSSDEALLAASSLVTKVRGGEQTLVIAGGGGQREYPF